MNPTYKPEQRKVPGHIYTPAGWMLGTFHVPKRGQFVEYLRNTTGFFPLTEVTLTGSTQKVPFFALQRSAVLLIVPHPSESLGQADGNGGPALVQRPVSCLLDAGVVHGTLELGRQMRTSDYLVSHTGFLVLRQVTLLLAGPQGTLDQRFPTLLVNSARVIGVSDTVA